MFDQNVKTYGQMVDTWVAVQRIYDTNIYIYSIYILYIYILIIYNYIYYVHNSKGINSFES